MHRRTLTWWKDQIGDKKLGDITAALIVEYCDKLAAGKNQRANPESKNTFGRARGSAAVSVQSRDGEPLSSVPQSPIHDRAQRMALDRPQSDGRRIQAPRA
jgi:hypothetical protein